MNKLLGIVLLGLCAGTISCSDKYVVVGVPTLQSLCESAVEKDFYEKADQLFSIVSKVEVSKADEQQLQKILEYNDRVQNSPNIKANIKLPSLLHLKFGKTPFYLAVKHDLNKVVLRLIAAGEDVHACDSNGRTALHVAAVNDSDKTTSLLLAAGTDVHARDYNGNTPLHSAAYHNAYKTTPLLLATGANVDAQNEDGDTPLHCAAYYNADKTTPLLLHAGANVDAQNRNGETPSVRTKSYCTIS